MKGNFYENERVALFIDGIPVPVDEVDAVQELGQFTYRPAEGKTFASLAQTSKAA